MVLVVFCPPVPLWGSVVFNSTDNEFRATVEYDCDGSSAFEDELDALEIGERAMHVSQPRTAYCSERKEWVPPLGNCISEQIV